MRTGLKRMGIVVIALTLIIGAFAMTPHPAFAQNGSCYSNAYKVGASGTKYYIFNGKNLSVTYQLWFCTSLGENFGTATMSGASGTSIDGQAGVHRSSGPDGGDVWLWSSYQTLYPGQTAYSPIIYSPHNLAQACWSDPNYYYCTGSY